MERIVFSSTPTNLWYLAGHILKYPKTYWVYHMLTAFHKWSYTWFYWGRILTDLDCSSRKRSKVGRMICSAVWPCRILHQWSFWRRYDVWKWGVYLIPSLRACGLESKLWMGSTDAILYSVVHPFSGCRSPKPGFEVCDTRLLVRNLNKHIWIYSST